MPTLWLFDIEPHEQRYTAEWRRYLPDQLRSAMEARAKKGWGLRLVEGGETTGTTSAGAFLNFAETNVYKSIQVQSFASKIRDGSVKKHDRLLFTDAWHPGIIQCRYISDLLDLELTIDAMWHAGSYDPWDFLGRKVANKEWSLSFERALFEAADRSYFATNFHRDLLLTTVKPEHTYRAKVVGWPMEYLPNILLNGSMSRPKDTILFPHRMTPEKQPEVFEVLEPMLEGFRVCYAQSKVLSKEEYHSELHRAAVVFSANKQETLGICPYEGLLCGAVPLVPDRLSYSEMYGEHCYPSEWTQSRAAAEKHAPDIIAYLKSSLDAASPSSLAKLAQSVGMKFFNGSQLYAHVLR